jgi:hypothetical protein
MSRVRLLIDEDAQRRDLAPELRARGVDVVTAFEAGLNGGPDEAVLEFAVREHRAVYKFNAGDFCRLHSEYLQQGLEHSGIIVAPSQRYSLGEQLRRLLRVISARSAEDFVNHLEFL